MTRRGDGPILAAVDFSACSEEALRWAAEAARCFSKPILVLHVVHDPAAAPGYYAGEEGEDGSLRLEQRARAMFDEFVERARAPGGALDGVFKLETRLVVGLPASRILEIADEADASMIVMGSQGRTGLDHLLLGSKAERVVRSAPMPVTIVKASPAGKDG